jgi:type II secretory pathway component PulJ
VASAISAILLVAIYGFFQRAMKTRDSATLRTRESALRQRAEQVIRNDLNNGFYSGGVIASSLVGSKQGQTSRFPGYLRLTTATGPDEDGYGEVQQVEYYLADSSADLSSRAGNSQAANNRNTGTLVRAVTRDRELLASLQSSPRQENLLSGVESFEVSFFDGSAWQSEWQMSGTSSPTASTGTTSGITSGATGSSVPQAIKVRVQQAATDRNAAPTPLEIEAPWSAQPIVSSTTITSGT